MTQYNMLEAKNNLSKICNAILSGEEECVLIAKNGDPVIQLTAYEKPKKRKAGCLKNKFNYNGENVDWFNDDITNLFFGEDE